MSVCPSVRPIDKVLLNKKFVDTATIAEKLNMKINLKKKNFLNVDNSSTTTNIIVTHTTVSDLFGYCHGQYC